MNPGVASLRRAVALPRYQHLQHLPRISVHSGGTAMYDMNVMPYGADDERNSLIDDIDPDDIQALTDERLASIVGEPAAALIDDSGRALRFVAVDPSADGSTGFYVYGETPALHRTGVSDRQAAGLDPSPHTDAYDADDHNRPRNGLGTYHESDAAW